MPRHEGVARKTNRDRGVVFSVLIFRWIDPLKGNSLAVQSFNSLTISLMRTALLLGQITISVSQLARDYLSCIHWRSDKGTENNEKQKAGKNLEEREQRGGNPGHA